MREDICTIPVTDVFEENDGCPICRMKERLEQRALDYILGAAMMEPDVRIMTNKVGFCGKHLEYMATKKGGLPIALMLETHLEEIANKAFSSKQKDGKKISPFLKSCFVCDKVEWGMSRMIETTYITFEKDRDFRNMFLSQEHFCLPHMERLLNGVQKSALRRYKSEFCEALTSTVYKDIDEIKGDLKHYASMFDYRNSGPDADWGNSKTAISRAVKLLSSEKTENR